MQHWIWQCSTDIPFWHVIWSAYVDGVVQERRNSITNALESRLSHTKPSICGMPEIIFSFNILSLHVDHLNTGLILLVSDLAEERFSFYIMNSTMKVLH